MKCRYSLFVFLNVLVMLCAGCSHQPQVRVTLDDVLSDPEAYEDAELIITASIADVLERYSLYRDRRIEVTGELSYYGWRSFWTWYLMVSDQKNELRCYTKHYCANMGRDAGVMLKRAVSLKKPITVNGYLKNDGIDVREILYDGDKVMPAFQPPCMPIVPRRVN